MLRAFISVPLLLLGLPLGVAGQQRDRGVPVIAVIDFGTSTITPGEDVTDVGSGLAAMITTELANRPGIRVIDRQEVEDLIRTQQLSATGRVDDERAQRFGQLLGADYIVYGSVFLAGRDARLDLRLQNPWTSAIVKVDKRQGRRDDFLRMVERIADTFSTDVPAPERRTATADPPAAAILAYSRGLNFEQRRMASRAVEMYRAALEIFPDYEAAAAALARVDRGGRR